MDMIQQVRPGGEQQQTASNRQENKLAKKLACIFQKSWIFLSRTWRESPRFFSLRLEKPNILHKNPAAEENTLSPLIWTDRPCLVSVEKLLCQGVSPGRCFLTGVSQQAAVLPQTDLQKDSCKSGHPSARDRIPGEQQQLWRRRKVEEKKDVKSIQGSVVLRKWPIREEGKQSC